MMSISESLRWDAMKRMLDMWPSICQSVRALEEALNLPEPAFKRYVREPRRGVMVGMSLPDFDVFEALRELNSEWGWVKARLTAIEAALEAAN